MQPLKKSDPITAEALERMGFRFDDRFAERECIRVSPRGTVTGLCVRQYGRPLWAVSTSDVLTLLTTYTTLGELADLCRCLKIDLLEVPE